MKTDRRKRVIMYVVLIVAFLLVLGQVYRSRASLIAPYPGAPLCASHDNTALHGIWNATTGCHYDHEHGNIDFAAAALKFGVGLTTFTVYQVSYPWQTPNENLFKHGGYKWTYAATNDRPCEPGVVEAANGTDGFAVEFHARADGAEHLSQQHSAFIAVTVCNPSGQRGTLITGGWQKYGQRVSPYQGLVLNLPDTPQPAYPAGTAPYISINCYNDNGLQPDCGKASTNNTSTWVSRPQAIEPGNHLATVLFRLRDAMQVLAGSTRLTTPGGLRYLCGGATFNPAGCANNGTTATVHQVFGNVPAAWDMLDGVADGLVTYQGHTDRWGNLQPAGACNAIGLDCVPLYAQTVPVGEFATFFPISTSQMPIDTFSKFYLPERDQCWTIAGKSGPGGQPVSCDVGGVPSGWVGSQN